MYQDINKIKKKIKPVLESHGVSKCAIFGSFARGEADSKSDLDIVVNLKSGSTLFDLIELKSDLEKLLDRKVDVATYNALGTPVRERINKEAIRV